MELVSLLYKIFGVRRRALFLNADGTVLSFQNVQKDRCIFSGQHYSSMYVNLFTDKSFFVDLLAKVNIKKKVSAEIANGTRITISLVRNASKNILGYSLVETVNLSQVKPAFKFVKLSFTALIKEKGARLLPNIIRKSVLIVGPKLLPHKITKTVLSVGAKILRYKLPARELAANLLNKINPFRRTA